MKLKRYRRLVAVIAFSMMLIFAVTAWIVGGSLVSPASRTVGPPPSDLPIRSLQIESGSGSTLAAWHMPAAESQATIILLHPIRADRRSMLGRAKLLHASGFSVLMIDLRGHGESHVISG